MPPPDSKRDRLVDWEGSHLLELQLHAPVWHTFDPGRLTEGWQLSQVPNTSSGHAEPSGRDEAQQLPQVPAGRIVNACLSTSGAIAAAGLLLRGCAALIGPAVFHTDPEAVASLLQCGGLSFSL